MDFLEHERGGWRDLLHKVCAGHRSALIRILRETLAKSSVLLCDMPFEPAAGSGQRIIHIEAEPQFDAAGKVLLYAGIVQDVTERLVARERIKHMANFDALTDLPNRAQMVQRVERALEHARRERHAVALLQSTWTDSRSSTKPSATPPGTNC